MIGLESLAPALRTAVISIAGVAPLLDQWKGEPAVFTRRPAPTDAGSRICLISQPVDVGDMDALNALRPVATFYIAFYGSKGAPGSLSDDTRKIEEAAFRAREHFHRNRFSVQPEGYHVIDAQVRGPVDAPVDDDGIVGRLIILTLRLGEVT